MPQSNLPLERKLGMRLPACSTYRWRINDTCRRHSPALVRGLLNSETGTLAVWPQVEPGHGCGDHGFATRMEV